MNISKKIVSSAMALTLLAGGAVSVLPETNINADAATTTTVTNSEEQQLTALKEKIDAAQKEYIKAKDTMLQKEKTYKNLLAQYQTLSVGAAIRDDTGSGSSSGTSTSVEISESGFTKYKAQKSALLKKLNATEKTYNSTRKAYQKAVKSGNKKLIAKTKKAYKQATKAYTKAHENYSTFQRKNQQYVNYEKSLITTYTVDGVTTKITKNVNSAKKISITVTITYKKNNKPVTTKITKTWNKDTFKGTGKVVWKKTVNNVTVSITTNGDKNNGSVSVTIKSKGDPHYVGYNWGTGTTISTPQTK